MSILRDLFKYNAAFRVGAFFTVVTAIMILLTFVAPYGPTERRVVPRDLPPSFSYFLGTTSLGQDVFWVLAYAIRNSLFVAGLAVLIGRGIAVMLGSFAGYVGGNTDRMLSSLTDSVMVVPRLPLLILISFILRGEMNFVGLALLLGLLDWAWPSKRYRSQILSLREEGFTHTAVFSGMNTVKVILREHLPFLVPFLLADMVSGFLWAIGMEITLSILGLGNLDDPSLGTMIYWANYYQAMLARKLWWLVSPIVASIVIVVAFYLLSTSLTEYLDPRTRLKKIEVRN